MCREDRERSGSGWHYALSATTRLEWKNGPATNTGSEQRTKAMFTKTLLEPPLYFSYSQFFVYDISVRTPGCVWTDLHVAQGFARRDSVVSFRTILEFGFAHVSYLQASAPPRNDYERVIAVPLSVTTGTVVVDGPEELAVGRSIVLPVGDYQIIAAQCVLDGKTEIIDLFAEKLKLPLRHSRIIVADRGLNPPGELIETAKVA
jgi:hypothetical protein